MKAHAGGWLICGTCLRVRLSPVHLLYRLTGWCPGG